MEPMGGQFMRTLRTSLIACISAVAMLGCNAVGDVVDAPGQDPVRLRATIVPSGGGSYAVWVDTMAFGGGGGIFGYDWLGSTQFVWQDCSLSTVSWDAVESLQPIYSPGYDGDPWCGSTGSQWVCDVNAQGRQERVSVFAVSVRGERVDNGVVTEIGFWDLSSISIHR